MDKNIQITVQDDSPFYYGQKLYIVELIGSERFVAKCPVCDNTHKINVRGYDLEYPYCKDDSFQNNKDNNVLYLKQYGVFEYIVNEFQIKGEPIKSRYTDKTPTAASILWSAFSKGRYFDSVEEKTLYPTHVCKDAPKEGWSYNPNVMTYQNPIRITNDIHLTKKSADRMVEEINALQQKLLDEFNKRNHTDYTWPFNK